MNKVNQTKGITLIALVITIIVLIILAGIGISTLTGEGGLIEKAKYSAFLSRLTGVEEAVDIYVAMNRKQPTLGLVQGDQIRDLDSLKHEIGYFRRWSREGTKPNFEINAQEELVETPTGIVDLYYISKEEAKVNGEEEYILDLETGIIYEQRGEMLNGRRVHSKYGAGLAMGIEIDVNFEEEELGKEETPNLPFELIADKKSSNIYKLYSNGELYAKGTKGYEINTSVQDMEEINASEWKEYKVPSIIGDYKTIIPGIGTMYIIDEQDYLWAIGNNGYNKLGLTLEEQMDYTTRQAIKLNVDSKKIKKVYGFWDTTFVITQDNKLYAAGKNDEGQLGLGHTNYIQTFTNIPVPNVENIEKIYSFSSLFTIIQYNNDTFFYSGINNFGQIGNGTTEGYTSFTQIWNSGQYDIDQDIKEVLPGHSIMILKNDGTIWQAGFRGADGSAGGGDLSGSMDTLQQFPTTFGTNVEKIYQSVNARIIQRNVNGQIEIWGVPGDQNNLGLDESTNNSTKYHKIELPQELIQDGIKEIYTTHTNVYYITNSGKVWASGQNSGCGLGINNIAKPEGIIKLNIPEIETAYNIENVDISTNSFNTNGCMLFKGKDGKLYTTGNAKMLYGNNIMQTEWIKIASNVKSFTPGAGYIDNDNNLWVSGNDSRMLGLNESVQRNVPNFEKVTDSNIAGKVKEVKRGIGKLEVTEGELIVKTTDNKLYVTGLYQNDNGAKMYPGWSEQENKYTFVEVLDNVGLWNIGGRLVVAISENQLKGWGVNYGGALGINGEQNTPVILPVDDTQNITVIENIDDRVTCLVKNKELWITGANGHVTIGMPGVTQFIKHAYNFNGEQIKDIKYMGLKTAIVLTEEGNVYGWGYIKDLGIGSTSTDIQETPIKLPIENVKEIKTGNGFMLAIKEDGTVWGTGSNTTGALGRWQYADGKYSESYYQTAFDWVRCPDLEK